MSTSKSKAEIISKILAIAKGELAIKSILNPVCIIWDDEDLPSEDNIYILGNKRVNYQRFSQFVQLKTNTEHAN